ncbi:ABC transporter permease [Clostridium transplantifaecale]|uniref:ABC transporter permease n=1 Tax=Clostridium transplantifaecale TaxID=2479838 RepID=UPI000F638622|nr:ABC transporter permease [Clostridium transplantifaecale]
MNKFITMLKTELKLSFRGIDMIIFAICMPVVVTALMGIIYGGKPASPGADYTFLEQSFGAVSTIAVCAGGVMGLPLVISDYRQKKILKRFKITPSSPVLLLSVQVSIYMIYSLIALALVYLVSTLFFGMRLKGDFFPFIGTFFLVMLSMFSIGMMVGGVSPNAKIAGILASLLYFPMLIFSGATLPYEVMPPVLQKLAGVLPLTQGIKLLKATSLGLPLENVTVPLIVMVVIAVVCGGISLLFFKWE